MQLCRSKRHLEFQRRLDAANYITIQFSQIDDEIIKANCMEATKIKYFIIIDKTADGDES